MKANHPGQISDADMAIFEGPGELITGEVLFDLNHRFGIGQIAGNWNEAHPNSTRVMQSYTLSNRLATIKKSKAGKGPKTIDQLTKELENALDAVDYKKNGKNKEVDVPYPRVAPITNSGAATASGGGGAPGNAPDDTEDADKNRSPSAGVEPEAEKKGTSKKRQKASDAAETEDPSKPQAEGEESDVEVEKPPPAKRRKTKKNAPSKKSSKEAETDDTANADGISEAGGEAEGAGQDEGSDDNDGAVPVGGAGGAGGTAGGQIPVPYGGATQLTADPSSIYVGGEWNEAQKQLGVISREYDDESKSPPHPKLKPAGYTDMGLMGTAAWPMKEQDKLRSTKLTLVTGEGTAAPAGQESSKGDDHVQEEVGKEAGEDGAGEDGAGEESDEQGEEENDA